MSILAVIIVVLTIIAIGSAAVLVRAAYMRPRIGALTERAVIAVLLAVFGIVYSLVAIDTEFGRTILALDIARVIVRTAVIVLLSVPAYWSLLYLTGRLGGVMCGAQDDIACPNVSTRVYPVTTEAMRLWVPLCETHRIRLVDHIG